MKNKTFKKLLCLSLSAAMLAGEPLAALASEVPAEPQEEAAVEEAEETAESADVTDTGEEAAVEETKEAEPELEMAESEQEEEPDSKENLAKESAAETESEDSGLVMEKKTVGETSGLKVVPAGTLDNVSGIVYDAKEKRIYWNKVKNATYYQYTITNTATNQVVDDYYYDDDDYRSMSYGCSTYVSLPAGKYTISITAVDRNDVYVLASNLPSSTFWSTWSDKCDTYLDYNGADGSTYYNAYSYLRSKAPAVASFTVAAEPEDMSKTKVSVLGALSYKETTQSAIVFRINRPKLLNGERIEYEYSNNANFTDDEEQNLFTESSSIWEDDSDDKTYSEVRIPISSFSMGDTCYVRARIYSSNYTPAGYENIWNRYDNGEITYEQAQNLEKQLKASRYGKYATASRKIPSAKVTNIDTVVTSSTVTLIPETDGNVTGYEVAKKVNGKWSTLAKQTEPSYQEKGLSAKKTYEYRIRGYQYNKLTKKTSYTSWKTVKAATWGANLKLKASAASSTSIKLTWKKISGVKGYEIYRINTTSRGKNKSEGIYDDAFRSGTLIKTIKKSGTTKYTDKKLTSGASYTYVVRAYRTEGKTKNYIKGEAKVRLQAENAAADFQPVEYYTDKGKLKVTWDKMAGIKGYKVEKEDPKTGERSAYKTLKSSAVSITFPKVAPGKRSVTYRIRPYTKDRVYDGYEVTADAALATVTNVKASAVSNGIKVSWKAVSGADYYRVYRTTDPNYTYDKTSKTYQYSSDADMVHETAIDTTGLEEGYNQFGSYKREKITSTSVVDQTLTYKAYAMDANGDKIQIGTDALKRPVYKTINKKYNQGPEKGVKYYYYVIAYADAPNGSTESSGCSSYASKTASATFTTAKPAKVKKITSLKSSKKGQATIKYSKVSKASGYVIYRATSKKGTYVPVARTSKTSFTDKGLSSKKTYYYKVASYKTTEAKSYVDSGMSGYKKVKIK